MAAQHERRNEQQSEGSCSYLQRHYEEPQAASSMQTYTAVILKPTILASRRPFNWSSTSAFSPTRNVQMRSLLRPGNNWHFLWCCRDVPDRENAATS